MTLPNPDVVAEQLVELAILLPALPDALPRDSGQGSDGPRVSTSANVHTLPINADVAQALTRLHGLDLRWLRARWDAAYTAGDVGDAWHIARTIGQHLADARHALRLDRPDQPLPGPRHCPHHDEPLTPLVVPGDRGTLRYEQLDRAGKPVDAWISWAKLEIVRCRHCGETWTPAQYMWLGRLVTYADNRRARGRIVEA